MGRLQLRLPSPAPSPTDSTMARHLQGCLPDDVSHLIEMLEEFYFRT